MVKGTGQRREAVMPTAGETLKSSVCSEVVSQDGSGIRSQPCTQASEESPSEMSDGSLKATVLGLYPVVLFVHPFMHSSLWLFNIHILNGNDFVSTVLGSRNTVKIETSMAPGLTGSLHR